MPAPRPRVSVINSNEEIVLALRELLDAEGFDASTAHVFDFKTGRTSVVDFLRDWDPEVVVYDVAPPYDTNWSFLQTIQRMESAKGRTFIVTTTNKGALKKIAGAEAQLEILGKPEDMIQIMEAVKRAFAARRRRAA